MTSGISATHDKFQAENTPGLWWRLVTKLCPQNCQGQRDLSFWRSRILTVTLLSGVLFALYPYIHGSILAVRERSWGILIVDTLVYVAAIFLLFARRLKFETRAIGAIVMLYSVGITILFYRGPVTAGLIFLFAFSLFGGVLLGLRAAVVTILVNSLSLIVIGWLIHVDMLAWSGTLGISTMRWVVTAANFFFLAGAATISTAVLTEGLQSSLLKEHQGAEALEKEASERLRMQEALQESEERFKLAAKGSSDGLWDWPDMRQDEQWWSPQIFELTGFDPQEARPSASLFMSCLHPDDKQTVEEAMNVHLKYRQPYDCEFRIKVASGDYRWFRSRGQAVWSSDGLPVRMVGSIQDVHDRKMAEARLRESEERYRALVENMPIACYTFGEDGRILSWNREAENTYGYTRQDAVGAICYTLLAPKEAEKERREIIRRVFSGERIVGLEWTSRRKDGRAGWAYGNAFPLFKSAGEVEYGVNMNIDVTAQKQIESARVLLAAAVEQAHEIILMTDTEGTIQYVNPSFERITGYTSDEVIGRKPNILKSGRHDKPFYKSMWRAIKQGESWRGRLENRKKDGSLYEEEATITPIRGANGVITHFVAVKRDVTQEARLEEQLWRSQKSQALGTLAGGIAHDFNNILSAIIGYSELTLGDLPGNGAARGYLGEVLKAGRRAKELVNQILTFTRHVERERAPIKVSLIVKEALKLLRPSLPTTIEIRWDLASNGVVVADATQIHQLIMNLCTNAYHSMREKGGVLEVFTSDVEITSEMAKVYPDLKPGPYLLLTVKDSGHGIDPAILDRIFDPYFTTKEKGEGTGLGLAVVHGIVKSHGGVINVWSEPGKGTEFQAYLPLIKTQHVENAPLIETIPRGNERVLLIDDEEQLAKLGSRILERLGYRVTVMTSSVKALELIRERADEFDVVITDMTMPEMTGAELSRELLEIRNDLPIILCTGYSELISREQARELGISEFLEKPLSTTGLAKAVRQALRKKEGVQPL